MFQALSGESRTETITVHALCYSPQVDEISINKAIIHANIKLPIGQVPADFYFLGTWMVRLDILAHYG